MITASDNKSSAPWPLEWTDEHIRRFWDWFATQPQLADNYFARQVGHSVLAAAAAHVGAWGTVVDFGAGRGDLTALLLARGARVYAVDQSPASVAILLDRFGGHPGFLGAAQGSAALPDGVADAVTLLEILEHLTDAVSRVVLSEVRRLLKPGGRLVVTTPHDEDLTQTHRLCPACSAVFSITQHQRSFTAATMAAHLEAHGFRTRTSRATYFTVRRGLHARLELLRRRIGGYPTPNLLYVGERP